MRRLVSAAAVFGTFAILAFASPAHADICSSDPDGSGPLPWIYYPCPSPEDQPAPLPVAVVTAEFGPGYYLAEYDFIRVKRGGRIYFVNDALDLAPHTYRGTGFDSGVVNPGQTVEVSGVRSLAVGHYKVYDFGVWVGDLYIDPSDYDVTVGCGYHPPC